jgi:hypothetical protein
MENMQLPAPVLVRKAPNFAGSPVPQQRGLEAPHERGSQDFGIDIVNRQQAEEVARQLAGFADRIATAERRIAHLLNGHGHRELVRVLKNCESSIAWLESRALRPEDRPNRQPEAEAAPAPVESPFAAAAELHLQRRCERLERVVDGLLAREAAATERLKTAAAKLDVLEKKCLLPQERRADDLPVRLRNLPGGMG